MSQNVRDLNNVHGTRPAGALLTLLQSLMSIDPKKIEQNPTLLHPSQHIALQNTNIVSDNPLYCQ